MWSHGSQGAQGLLKDSLSTGLKVMRLACEPLLFHTIVYAATLCPSLVDPELVTVNTGRSPSFYTRIHMKG